MNASPIEARDRIASLDVIRGFALFGIFLANMPLFQWPVFTATQHLLTYDLTAIDQWIRMLLDVFIETKFFSIFSFLFGLGFYLFMSRAEEKGQRVYRLFSRRLFILALFGLIHLIFFWYGDILLIYACAGFVLILFYKIKPKTILIWIFSLMFVLVGLLMVNFLLPADVLEELIVEEQSGGVEKIEETIDVYHHASYVEWLKYRFTREVIPALKDVPYGMLPALFMFLIGLYAGKRGYFREVSKHRPFIKRVCWTTGLLGIPFSVLIMMLHQGVIDFGLANIIVTSLLTTISGPVIGLFYVSVLVLLLEKARWQRRLRPLGFAGRMALTNYITQTLIAVTIFTGLNYFGTMNLRLGIVLCVIVYVVQIILSYYWLKHYRFGPLEWLWRSLTYGKRQPLRK